MICPNCGNEIEKGTKFCGNCGTPVREDEKKTVEPSIVETVIATGAPSLEPMEIQSPNGFSNATFIRPEAKKIEIPIEYKPISMWGYFLYSLLFAIPLVGLVFLLIFSFGGTQNKNLKNYARASFCWVVIVIVIGILLAILMGIGAANS